MGRGFVDAGIARGELGAAEDISASHDDGNLHAVFGGLESLLGDVQNGVHGNAAFARMRESFTGNFQHDATVFGPACRHIVAHLSYSLGNSQCTKRMIFMPASWASWPTVFLPYFISLAIC